MPNATSELALAADMLAVNASFEAARGGEAGQEFALLAEQLRALTRKPTERAPDNTGGEPVDEAQKKTDIGACIAGTRQNQCEISGLADRIAATAQRMTRALRHGNAVARVVDYSRDRADRLRQLVGCLEMQQQEIEAALAVDREQLDQLEQALAAASGQCDGACAPVKSSDSPQVAGPWRQ